jgi:nitrate/nitrite transporter NarK
LAAIVLGLAMGAEGDVIAYLTSRYFGLRSFGQIYGLAFAAFALGGTSGPYLMGAVFDCTGSYKPALAAFSVITAISAVMMTRLGPYRYARSRSDEISPEPHNLEAGSQVSVQET